MVYDLCDKKLWKRSGLGLGILYIHRWARCRVAFFWLLFFAVQRKACPELVEG